MAHKTLGQFIEELLEQVRLFKKFYQDGIDGPSNYLEVMHVSDWYDQFVAYVEFADTDEDEEDDDNTCTDCDGTGVCPDCDGNGCEDEDTCYDGGSCGACDGTGLRGDVE